MGASASDDALKPLAGVKVVELGRFAAGPSCATVLADWGADVIKIEPPAGDPARDASRITDGTGPVANPRFEVHNRSRRSLTLDLRLPKARSVASRLFEASDVLVTNVSPGALRRLRLDAESLRAAHPHLVIAQVTGYDAASPLADDRSYDHGAFWSYSGVASLFAAADGEPPQPTGGFGDRAAGVALAGGVAAALFSRSQHGRGSHVSISLANTAIWLMASDLSDAVSTGRSRRSPHRVDAPIPTVNCFRTADARWLWLQVMSPDEQWPALLSALDAHWLDDDPRFRGGHLANLKADREGLLELLDEIFSGRPLAEWLTRLTTAGIASSPVRSLDEVAFDQSIRSSSAFIQYDDEHGARHVSVNTPCNFDGHGGRHAWRAPRLGEHTDEILAGLGLSTGEIRELRTTGGEADR